MTNSIDEKLALYHSKLIDSIDQKLVQIQELTKLTINILPNNAMPINECILRFNEFLASNTQITQQIVTQFSSFLNQDIK